jgi:hypothetical protein
MYQRKQFYLIETLVTDTLFNPFLSAFIKNSQLMKNIHEFQNSLSIIQIFSEKILPNAFNTIINDNEWHDKKVDRVDARVFPLEYETIFFINQATKELSVLLLRSLGFYKYREFW